MNEDEVKKYLINSLKFTGNDIERLKIFSKYLLEYNVRYNLISKSTEKSLWNRHILDSAQLLNYINVNSKAILADFGTGAGFPGLILAIYNKNPEFHVKLYDKSPVKRQFINKILEKLDINAEVRANVNNEEIQADYIVCRAFKKLKEIIKISREIVKKPHKIIILKGKNAQEEINKVSLGSNCSYKLEKSITNNDSKIIIFEVS